MSYKPIYVKVDEYKDVEDVLSEINARVSKTKENLKDLKQLKSKEEEFIKSWEKDVSGVEQQLRNIRDLLRSEEEKWVCLAR